MKTSQSGLRRDLAAMERRRLEAAQLFSGGLRQGEVARRLAVSTASVNRWHQAWKAQGESGLRRKAIPGPAPRLSTKQLQQLEGALLAGPAKAGYVTELWTGPRIKKLIWDRFRVHYHRGHVWLLLRKLGWTCQKPATRAVERDEEAIQTWVKRRWPRIKKGR